MFSRCRLRRDSSRPAWLLTPAPTSLKQFLRGDPRRPLQEPAGKWLTSSGPGELLQGPGYPLEKCPLCWQSLPLPHRGLRKGGAQLREAERGLVKLWTSPLDLQGLSWAGVQLCRGLHMGAQVCVCLSADLQIPVCMFWMGHICPCLCCVCVCDVMGAIDPMEGWLGCEDNIYSPGTEAA